MHLNLVRLALILLIAAASHSVFADPLAVVGVKGDTVGIYDDAFQFKEDRPTKAFLNGRNLAKTPIPVLQRSEKGFVQLSDGGITFWVDATDLILNQENSSTINCVRVVHAKAPDSATAAAMGVIACQ